MKIGNVKLNLDYYNGVDSYSDGPIEQEILKIVKSGEDISKVLNDDNRWPILYHLSPIRRNLLEGFDFGTNSSILEIGAGCGALTGVLCENAKRVVSVELSMRRAEIIAYRYKDFKNLEVVVGNLNDIKFSPEEFDCITLIGVLEYAKQFTEGLTPEKIFLQKIKNILKPDGKLYIAIENKLGLKYWAGAAEDHTGRFFDNIENYPGNQQKARTFSKNELDKLLRDAGFKTINFYYPLPDYKMPTQIYSDNFLPSEGNTVNYFPNYDLERLELFNEKLAAENILNSGLFCHFANSFLVVCDNT